MKIKKFFTLLVLTGLVFSCSDDDPAPPPPPVLSTEANILTFTLTDQTGPATLNASAATVEIEVENGTDLSSLSPAFTVSAGASASPASGTSGDYSSQVTITVTAENGTTTKAWSVDVSEATAAVESSETDILTFSLPDETGNATIDDTAHTIAIEVANGTDLTMLTPAFTISTGATADPASGTLGDYSSEVTITVTAEDGTTMQDWAVNVTEASAMASSDTDILLFLLADQTALAGIDKTNHTVAIEVVNGTDLSSLTPVFLISIGATSVPESGTAGNYSSAVTITITAEDGTTMQDWTVNVSEAAAGLSDKTDILAFSIPEQSNNALIDGDTHKVTVEVASGINLASLTPSWILSPGATSVPASETTGDYSSDVTIAVTAEDGTTTQDWIVEVYVQDDFDASIFCDENLCTNNAELQQECEDFLIECLVIETGQNYDECLIAALSICKE